MAVIRLYRRFYKINGSRAGDSYSLINPTSISAIVYIKDTSTVVESVSTINKESDGIYFVDLNPIYYSYENAYDLKWTVGYLPSTNLKTLTTSFKLNPINIYAGNISAEINEQEIECKIDSQIIEVIIL